MDRNLQAICLTNDAAWAAVGMKSGRYGVAQALLTGVGVAQAILTGVFAADGLLARGLVERLMSQWHGPQPHRIYIAELSGHRAVIDSFLIYYGVDGPHEQPALCWCVPYLEPSVAHYRRGVRLVSVSARRERSDEVSTLHNVVLSFVGL